MMRSIVCVLVAGAVAAEKSPFGVCGDGVCYSPEFSESCASDCGETVRNPRLIGRDPNPPYFWRSYPVTNPITYVNISSLPGEDDVLRAVVPKDTSFTQSGLFLTPSHKYSLNVSAHPSHCVEVFAFTNSQIVATGASSVFIAPPTGEEVFLTIKALCDAVVTFVSLKPLPETRDIGWKYADIVDSILDTPKRLDANQCKAECLADSRCCAWQVCPGSEAEGCQGCYLLGRKPDEDSAEEKKGWFAGVERLAPIGNELDAEKCRKWLVEQSAHESDFYDPKSAKVQKYHDCGAVLRTDKLVPKQVFVGGAHYPTILVANHRTPEPKMRADSSDQTPILPHFMILPFYDTNIGNMMKTTSSMNIMQSYEMQSILRPGDVFIDVGANLGSYTIPMAEHLGPAGMVLAFEPFRWMYQLLTANVALNGLMNVWTFQLALSDVASRQMLMQPQLRFFSSPGGVRVNNQTGGMTDDVRHQMYDEEWGLEAVDSWPLDDIIFGGNWFESRNTQPRVGLIKIDVEGMEGNVIRGASRLIQTFKPVIWTENVDYFETGDTSFLNLMESLNYVCSKAANAPNDLICQDKDGQGIQPM